MLSTFLILAAVRQRPIVLPVRPKVAWFAPNYAPGSTFDGMGGYYVNKGFYNRVELESNGRNLSAIPRASVDAALKAKGLDPAPPASGYPEAALREIGASVGARYVAFVTVKKIATIGEAYLLSGTLTVLDVQGGAFLNAVEVATMPLVDPLKPKGLLPALKDKAPTTPEELGAHLARNAAARLSDAKPKP